MTSKRLWAPQAWVGGRWRHGVSLGINAQGHWDEIAANVHTPPPEALVLNGPTIPGLVNAHSHAFQRAFAGLAERRDANSDDFWSWRDRMYGVASRISADQMRTVASQLFIELLKGGYTQVCEFHYIHRAETGNSFDDPAAMSVALADASEDAGIGLTLLPVLYERAGFSLDHLRDDQRRFAGTPELICHLSQYVRALRRRLVTCGVALHSLRAVPRNSIAKLLGLVGDDNVPIHIHIAEQVHEIDQCLAATGARPIEYLVREFSIDSRWLLVHATHATPGEIDSIAASGACIAICPTTEANLGDGLINLPAWLSAAVPMAIGSDSHVSRSWVEELRWLEYGQRLSLKRRNIAAHPESGQPATAARLFDAALDGGRQASGMANWGFVKGARADALVLDAQSNALLGIPTSYTLDALVFASSEPVIRDVFVAGEQRIFGGKHPHEVQARNGFSRVMRSLWG